MGNNHTYPVVAYAVPGTKPVVCSSADNGKKKSRGQSELVVFARMAKYGCGEIREDACVRLCGHNYEPDFAYINEEKGVFIDIEIDEPYSSTGHPTHYLMSDGTNVDSVRNQRFQEAGWHVVRFSEEQMFCHTRECLLTVYRLALEVGAVDEIPKALQDAPKLQPMPRWNKGEAYELWRQHHRKSYLGYNPEKMDFGGALHCGWLLIPVLWQSVKHPKVRHEMCRQLKNFLSRRR